MIRLRLLLACLLMATLPLQGWAAAAMLSCGVERHQPHAVDARGEQATAPHGHAQHTVAVHPTSLQAVSDAGDGHYATGAGHQCGLCATCSHAVGITAAGTAAILGLVPRARLAAPLVVVLSRSLPLPDKPPRA